MRSPEDILQDMEQDRLQREGEIRLIENLASQTENEAERNMLRRSLVLLTYAHMEGFCRFTLYAYVAAVNSAKISCRDAAVPLVAATLTKVFGALREINRKEPLFSKVLPHDQKLHLAAREQHFVESYEQVTARIVEIPDQIVDTESNLKAVVLKKILYQLGLNFTSIDPHSNSMEKLLGLRNAIAHGDALKVPREDDVQEFLTATFTIMGAVQAEIYGALKTGAYRKNAT